MKLSTRIKTAFKALAGEYNMDDFDKEVRVRYRGGSSHAGVEVDESSAMRFISVYSCVRVLAEAIASLPITVHQERANGRGSDKVRDHPLFDLLYTAPNTDMTTVSWREQQIASMALAGNCYSVISRNGRGDVIDLYPVPWTDCTPERDLSDYRIYYNINDRGKFERFPATEVFHVPGMGFDGIQGYSPVRMAAEAIGTGIAAEQFNARFFGQGMNVGSVLETDKAMSDKAFDRLRDDFEERGSGLANSWRPLVLEEGLKFNRIPMPLKDAQFIEGRQFTRSEIAGLFRVPPHMIADLSRSTFSNIEHQSIDFVTYSLMPYIVAWEKAISWRLLTPSERRSGLYIKFNVAGLLRGDYKSRQEGLAIQRQNGVISTNDWLEIEDMNPRDDVGAESLLVNGNMISVEVAAGAKPNGGGGTGAAD
ncbi:phage portal protein [Paenibacillus sp. 1011MAR3C5]|uniref:phage portal protein n=1 Tax=Paenibacillus sp. 1011MAR3C5 TaxID=1675787 RepID=UPI002175CF48|nr:phage portal protein [Paenibacillus sp. 1011MAR3C5]